MELFWCKALISLLFFFVLNVLLILKYDCNPIELSEKTQIALSCMFLLDDNLQKRMQFHSVMKISKYTCNILPPR